jgi:hypothetical protein
MEKLWNEGVVDRMEVVPTYFPGESAGNNLLQGAVKPLVAQLPKNFSKYCRNWRIITVFTRAY